MEREFRGKRADNGEWVFGYYVKDPMEQHRIYWKPFGEASSNTYHFVIPETIGQFTGLVDKNGVKIFEGDILKADSWKFLWVVQFDTKKARFNCIVNQEGFQNDFIPQNMVAVIGNIHDNKELIQK